MAKKKRSKTAKKSTKSTPKVQKTKSSPIFISAVVVLLLLGGLFVYMTFFSSSKAVAYVNNYKITEQELTDAYDLSVPELYRQFISPQIFLEETLIPQQLLRQQIAQAPVEITDEDVEQVVQDMMIGDGLSQEDLEQELSANGLTINDLRAAIKDRLSISTFLDENVFSTIEITPQEIEQRYDDLLLETQNMTLEQASLSIEQQLRLEKGTDVYAEYIQTLRDDAVITVVAHKKVENLFTQSSFNACQDGDRVMHLFSSTTCESCQQEVGEFAQFMSFLPEWQGHAWELDTGDDLLTIAIEEGVPSEILEVFKQASPKGTVPTYVLGCRYSRSEPLPEEYPLAYSLSHMTSLFEDG